MKIATFNIQNIFHRDASFVEKSFGRSLSAWLEEFEFLMRKDIRMDNDYARMRELSFLLGFHKTAVEPYVVLRRKAGQLYMRKRNAGLDHKATDLTNWNGWIKVNSKPINPMAVQNKAKVISEVNPDILVLQEVEDRQSLLEFNEHCLPENVGFSEVMVVPGNDPRGVEMGIMAKNHYQVLSVKSHSNDLDNDGNKIFDNDFQEYEIKQQNGETIWILVAHLQEITRDKDRSDAKRKGQAEKIAGVYRKMKLQGKAHIAVVGTLNTVSYCDSLSPLLRETDLKDVVKHPSFNVDFDSGKDAGYFSLGAYRMGVNIKQRDYLVLSPDLFRRVGKSGLHRKAMWPGKKPQWSVYPTLKSENQMASSHPIIWAALAL